MTLYERAQHVRMAEQAQVDQDIASLARRLRSAVEGIVPVDELARLVATDPIRAHNEVRSACRRVLDQPAWSMVSPADRNRISDLLIDSMFGFGVLEDLLNDGSITEIMVNGPKNVFIERGGVIEQTGRSFHDEADLRAFVDRVLGPLGRRVDESSPMVNARLPQGYRMNVVVPPIAIDGPYVTIRKFADRVIELSDLEEIGSLEPSVVCFLAWAVRARKSIAVSGGTGSGKTTLLNALSCEIDESERIVTIEDSAELRFLRHPHVVRMEARSRNSEGTGEVTIRDLVINALRMRPDRIVVGECRGAEALDMIQAMTTGHEGSMTTLHANSPKESIARLATMVRFGVDLPVDVIESNIASAIDLIVQTQRTIDGRRFVSEIAELSYDAEQRACVVSPLYIRGIDGPGNWLSVPVWVDDLALRSLASSQEVEEWKHQQFSAA